jgi:hypothetical protein
MISLLSQLHARELPNIDRFHKAWLFRKALERALSLPRDELIVIQ